MPPIARYFTGFIESPGWSQSLDVVQSTTPVILPSAVQVICRSYEATIDDVSKTDRSIVAKINTGDVDRYRTVISPDGIDLVGYRKNPVVLWEHGKDPQRGSLPIGKNQWIKSGGSGHGALIAKTLFGNDEYSRSLFDMYEDGTLRGWSVNILPNSKMCSPPTKEEMRARPELSDCTMMYRSGELAEYSGVAVPGNAETLSMLAERGIWCPVGTSSSMSEEKSEKEKPVRTKKERKKSDPKPIPSPDGLSRSIIQSNGTYRVFIGSQVILETSSKETAEATLEAIDAPLRTWSEEYNRVIGYQIEWQKSMERDTKALLDLLYTGRV